MRAFWVLLVACLISLCPLFCCADEIGHSVHHEQGGQVDPHNGDVPDHCPDSVDNCVCQGAVQANDVRVLSVDVFSFGPFYFPTAQLNSLSLIQHLTPAGSPTGLALRGDALTVRAYLQIFRF